MLQGRIQCTTGQHFILGTWTKISRHPLHVSTPGLAPTWAHSPFSRSRHCPQTRASTSRMQPLDQLEKQELELSPEPMPKSHLAGGGSRSLLPTW